MNSPVKITTRPQLALQSYLDALLQDATEELELELEALTEVIAPQDTLDEFQAAVLEEQARDAQQRGMVVPAVAAAVRVQAPMPIAVPVLEAPAPILAPVSLVAPMLQALVEPVAEVHLPPSN